MWEQKNAWDKARVSWEVDFAAQKAKIGAHTVDADVLAALAAAGKAEPTDPFSHLPWAELITTVGKYMGDPPPYDVGDLVWVMFEKGDHLYPVIVGGWHSVSYGVPDLHPDQTVDYPRTRLTWVRSDQAGNAFEMSSEPGKVWARLSSGTVSLTACQSDSSLWLRAEGGLVGVDAELLYVHTTRAFITGKDIILDTYGGAYDRQHIGAYSQCSMELLAEKYMFVGQYADRSDVGAAAEVYSALRVYAVGGVCTYLGITYRSKVDLNDNNTPPHPTEAAPGPANTQGWQDAFWIAPAYAMPQGEYMRLWPKRVYIGITPEEYDRYAEANDLFVLGADTTDFLSAAGDSFIVRTPGARMNYQDRWTTEQITTQAHAGNTRRRTVGNVDAWDWRGTRNQHLPSATTLTPSAGEGVIWPRKRLILGSDKDVVVAGHHSFIAEITGYTLIAGVPNRWRYDFKRRWKTSDAYAAGAWVDSPKDEDPGDSDAFDSTAQAPQVYAYNFQEIGAVQQTRVPNGTLVRVWQTGYVTNADAAAHTVEYWFEPVSIGSGPGSDAEWFHFRHDYVTLSPTQFAPIVLAPSSGGGAALLPGAVPPYLHAHPFLAECHVGYITEIRGSITLGNATGGAITGGDITLTPLRATQADTRGGNANTWNLFAPSLTTVLDAAHNTNISMGGACPVVEGDGVSVVATFKSLVYYPVSYYAILDCWIKMTGQ